MKMLTRLAAIALLLASPALAQTNPGLTQNQKLTPAQWNNLFASKQDTLGYTPLNQAGGSMTGRLITQTSGASTSGFNLTPGGDPSSPVNGDIWATNTTLKARVNGVTISLGTSSGSVQSVGLAMPAIFNVTGSPVTVNGTLTAALANQNANLVWAGPASGSAAAPTFRSLVNLDFPSGFVNCGTGLTGGTLSGGGTCAADQASASNYFAGTSNKLVGSGVIYQAETTTTYGATTTFDFSTFINTAITLTGNITTMTFANVQAGKAGTIRFIQDGAGNRTTVWNSILKWPGGNQPVLTTGTAGAIDVLNYNCVTTTYCQASLAKLVQ